MERERRRRAIELELIDDLRPLVGSGPEDTKLAVLELALQILQEQHTTLLQLGCIPDYSGRKQYVQMGIIVVDIHSHGLFSLV